MIGEQQHSGVGFFFPRNFILTGIIQLQRTIWSLTKWNTVMQVLVTCCVVQLPPALLFQQVSPHQLKQNEARSGKCCIETEGNWLEWKTRLVQRASMLYQQKERFGKTNWQQPSVSAVFTAARRSRDPRNEGSFLLSTEKINFLQIHLGHYICAITNHFYNSKNDVTWWNALLQSIFVFCFFCFLKTWLVLNHGNNCCCPSLMICNPTI